jgi:hypothetical protein
MGYDALFSCRLASPCQFSTVSAWRASWGLRGILQRASDLGPPQTFHLEKETTWTASRSSWSGKVNSTFSGTDTVRHRLTTNKVCLHPTQRPLAYPIPPSRALGLAGSLTMCPGAPCHGWPTRRPQSRCSPDLQEQTLARRHVGSPGNTMHRLWQFPPDLLGQPVVRPAQQSPLQLGYRYKRRKTSRGHGRQPELRHR